MVVDGVACIGVEIDKDLVSPLMSGYESTAESNSRLSRNWAYRGWIWIFHLVL